MFHSVFAHLAVRDLEAAERWYTVVFDRPPDGAPMPGLVEWHVGAGVGVQVFEDRERAGGSTAVVGTTDLQRLVAHLDRHRVVHGPIEDGGGGRLVQATDPDGNRVVVCDDDAAGGPAARVTQRTLRVQGEVPAPTHRVWQAYADVRERQTWAAPPGEAVIYDRSDFSVGGLDEYRCGPPHDLANLVTVRYHDIVPDRGFLSCEVLRRHGRTVATSILDWTLEPVGPATTVVATVQVASTVGPALIQGFRNGHARTLDSLREHLDTSSALHP